MTGSLVAPVPLSSSSPVRLNCSVDSFSEFSARNATRASFSPISAASGPQSARAKEEDEELFRDLFAAEYENDANDDTSKSTAPSFLPQKPATQRAPSSTGNPNPRQHLGPMTAIPPQLVLGTPFIPRLRLEELVIARPDDDDEMDNNSSQITFRSELEQVGVEDDRYSDGGPNEDSDGKAAMRKAQVVTRDRGFNSSLGNASSNQRADAKDTLRFLEKVDLNSLLHTPRPDLLSFYPSLTTTPTVRNKESPRSKALGVSVKVKEDGIAKNHSGPDNDRFCVMNEKSDKAYKDPHKTARVDAVASRLAHMESTYGTAPIVRKTRRETIDRLANPISGYSSTLQALPRKQREKREAVFTGQAPISPISAAIAVSCRRSTTTKKRKTPRTLLGGLGKNFGDCEIPVPAMTTSKRKVGKHQDPLVQKRRSNTSTNSHVDGEGPFINGLPRKKSKTALGSRSLVARKEALKKKLQSQSSATKRAGDRKIGGSTFLTQRDDEEGVEQVEDFISRSRGAGRVSLTFRSSKKAAPCHATPALASRNPHTTRSAGPHPPNMRGVAGTSKSTYRPRGAHTSRELRSLINLPERKNGRSGVTPSTHDPVKLFQQPRRPHPWQTVPASGHNATTARSLAGRPTTPGGAANPLRKLQVHLAMPELLPHAPKPPLSAAIALLMGSTPPLSTPGKARRRVKEIVTRRADVTTSRGSAATSFDAPTKLSEQRKRLSGGEKFPVPRQAFAVRHARTI